MEVPPEICPHCGTSHKLIVQKFQGKMQHKYAVGEKVRIVSPHKMAGSEGEIAALMPYTFVEPAYYVSINGMLTAVSERSLEKEDEQGEKV